jgi:phospho-N-acetylmuramoyl-pentapeptide-transferase
MTDRLLQVRLEEALVAFWSALLVSLVLVYPIYILLQKMKSRQTVSQYAPEGHQIKQGTPTMGGLIVIAGVLAGLLPLLVNGHSWMEGIYAVLLVLGFSAIGFADDYVVPRVFPGKRGLGWKQKIVPQALLSLLALPALHLPVTPLDVLAAIFIVLFFANAYNFSDGLDGLAGSIGILLFGGFLGISLLSNRGEIAPAISGGVMASLVPFLFLNAPLRQSVYG